MTDDNIKILYQGAEGRIYVGKFKDQECLVKERFVKAYRHPTLDQHLTKSRMKAEEKAHKRCENAGVLTPKLFGIDFRARKIFMEYLKTSITAKQYIIQYLDAEKPDDNKISKLMKCIGINVAKLHDNNIIHGDLTSSNILIRPKGGCEDFSDYDIVMIDFGLSYHSTSVEDKGVDLYVLERALISTHSKFTMLFTKILGAYTEEYKAGYKDAVKKLNEVRARGRKRTMVG